VDRPRPRPPLHAQSKTKAGIRTLPIIKALRPILMREWLRQGKPESGLVVRGPNGGVRGKAAGAAS
jgi:hypothetical protein